MCATSMFGFWNLRIFLFARVFSFEFQVVTSVFGILKFLFLHKFKIFSLTSISPINLDNLEGVFKHWVWSDYKLAYPSLKSPVGGLVNGSVLFVPYNLSERYVRFG